MENLLYVFYLSLLIDYRVLGDELYLNPLHKLRFHYLKHEAISKYFEMRLIIIEFFLISKHKNVKLLFRYTHLKQDNLIAKYSKIF